MSSAHPLVDVVYRGPLERARLAFLVEATAAALGPVKLWWLAPVATDAAAVRHLLEFVDGLDAISDVEIVDGRYLALLAARSRLSSVLASTRPLVVVGDDALDFVRGARARALVWCVNGIPEERSLHPTAKDRTIVRAEWLARRIGRTPDLTVTVSEPMTSHLRSQLGIGRAFAAPCCVDLDTYRPIIEARDRGPVVAYMGSGARWQAIDRTAEIWAVAAAKRADLRFLVVSRDERCDALVEAVGGRGERVGVTQPHEVAAAMQPARVGMLVREDHVVNRAAFPTKLGEYLACGLSVLASDLAWDVGAHLADPAAGALVDPAASVDDHADALLALVDTAPDRRAAATAAAADGLSRSRWITALATELERVR